MFEKHYILCYVYTQVSELAGCTRVTRAQGCLDRTCGVARTDAKNQNGGPPRAIPHQPAGRSACPSLRAKRLAYIRGYTGVPTEVAKTTSLI